MSKAAARLPVATFGESDGEYCPVHIPGHGDYWVFDDYYEEFGLRSVMETPGDMGSALDDTYSYAYLCDDGVVRRFNEDIASWEGPND